MTLHIGDRLPPAQFKRVTADGPQDCTGDEIFSNRRVVLFAVPGAFTPTCHVQHLPGYMKLADTIKAKKVDAIYVTAVNDPFVMAAWKEASGCAGEVEFLADGSGAFARSIGMVLDASAHGMGERSKRYAMLVSDGVVEKLHVEDAPGTADLSSAEAMLKAL